MILRPELNLYMSMNQQQGGVVYDNSGQDNNGSIVGASKARVSLGNKAILSFDGIDDYLNLGTINQQPPLTLSIWIRPTRLTHGSAQVFWRHRTSGFTFTQGDGVVAPVDYIKVDLVSSSGSTSLVSTAALTGEWVLITVTLDGTTAKLYINGVFDISNTGLSDILYGAGFMAIGRDGDNNALYWQGFAGETIISGGVWSTDKIAKYYNDTFRKYIL